MGFAVRCLAGASVPEASEGSLVPTMPAVSRLHLNEVETPPPNPTSHTAFQLHTPHQTNNLHAHSHKTELARTARTNPIRTLPTARLPQNN